jgi:protein TonB
MTITEPRPRSAPRRRPVAVRRAPQRTRVVPARALYKAPSKWTTSAAFILAVAIHICAVVIAAMRPEEPPADLSPWPDQFTEVTFEAAAPEPPEPPPPQEEPQPLDPPPAPVEPPEFVEEKATPAPIRPKSNRPVTPLARPRTIGGPAGSMSMSSAKAVAISAPRPEYPYEARRARITGSGVVVMTVDPTTGTVTSAVMAQSTGSPVLDNAATSAFRRWRFRPGTVAKVRTPVTFTMSGAQF